MRQSNIPLLNESTIFTEINRFWGSFGIDQVLNRLFTVFGVERVPSTWSILIMMLIITFIIKLILDYFLQTELGLDFRATGDNENMIRCFSADSYSFTIIEFGLWYSVLFMSYALY